MRIRDVQQSPDGYIYVATEGRSGGNDADGTVLRIEPAEETRNSHPLAPEALRVVRGVTRE